MDKTENKLRFSMYSVSADGRIVNSRYSGSAMEIIEVAAGEVRVQIGTAFISAARGDFLFVPPETTFRVDSVDGTATVRGLTFDASIVEENMDNFFPFSGKERHVHCQHNTDSTAGNDRKQTYKYRVDDYANLIFIGEVGLKNIQTVSGFCF